MEAIKNVLVLFLCAIINLYRLLISPILGQNCRFYPTCSAYAKQALQSRGIIVGLYLTIRRILRCHPGNPGGYDPVLNNEDVN